MPLYWAHIANAETNKLALLISLKVTTDFFVKFDFSHFKAADKEAEEEEESPFEYGSYLSKLQKFVISSDPDIRILAIEGLCRLIFHNRVP